MPTFDPRRGQSDSEDGLLVAFDSLVTRIAETRPSLLPAAEHVLERAMREAEGPDDTTEAESPAGWR